jgi:hypothetical protein
MIPASCFTWTYVWRFGVHTDRLWLSQVHLDEAWLLIKIPWVSGVVTVGQEDKVESEMHFAEISLNSKLLLALSLSACCTFPNPPRHTANSNVDLMKFLVCASGKFARPNHITYGWWGSFLDFLRFSDSESNHNNWSELDLWIRIHKHHSSSTTMAFDEIENSARRERKKSSSKYEKNSSEKKYLISTRN